MKKLTLDQLEVENFATQPSEEELSNLKGGTSNFCIKVLVAVATYLGSRSSSDSNSSSGPYLQVTDSTATKVIGTDTTYFHSHTYKYGF